MVASDLEDIKRIDGVAFSSEEQYSDAVYTSMPQSGLSVVAENAAGLVVGYIFVAHSECPHPKDEIFAYIRSIAVRPDHRRQGYARVLLETVIERADREVDLFVDQRNEPAITLYRSLGFHPAEKSKTIPFRQRMVLTKSL